MDAQGRRRPDLTFWLAFVLLLSYIAMTIQEKHYKKLTAIREDVKIYYEILPATFEHHDPTFVFVDSLNAAGNYDYWTYKNPETGKRYMKYTIGLGYMYAPAYLGIRGIYHAMGKDPDDFAAPYHFAVVLSTLIAAAFGFWYSRRIFLHFFNEKVATLLLALVFFGTGHWHYTLRAPGYGHVFSYALIAGFIWFCIKYRNEEKLKTSLLIGLLLGLITIIRPTNAIVILFPFFYVPNKGLNISGILTFWFSRIVKLLPAMLMFALPIIPQLLLWKSVSGHWVIDTYGEEGFFFTNPQLLKGLFSFRNSFFIYTPLALLIFPGFWFLWKRDRALFAGVLSFMLLNCYIIYSWWCWWYGGSFGSRPQVDSLIITAIPIGVLFAAFWTRAWWRKACLAVVAMGCALNLFQSSQASTSLLHWDAMTAKSYVYIFGRTTFPKGYPLMIANPDYAGALHGKEYPANIDVTLTQGQLHFADNEEYPIGQEFKVQEWLDKGVTKVYLSVQYIVDWDQQQPVWLVLTSENPNYEMVEYVSTEIFKPDMERAVWLDSKIELQLPKDRLKPGAVVKAFIYNPNKQHQTIKNLRVTDR